MLLILKETNIEIHLLGNGPEKKALMGIVNNKILQMFIFTKLSQRMKLYFSIKNGRFIYWLAFF